MAHEIDEQRANETDGKYDDGTARPTDYAFGVQNGRRDAAIYGARNVRMFPDNMLGDYATGYNAAVRDAM